MGIDGAQQNFKDQCDINKIVARAKKSGVLPVSVREPVYGDFSDCPSDFLALRIKLNNINSAFMRLPAAIRLKFANDVSNLVEFLSKPENDDEAIKLGLKPKPVEKKANVEPDKDIKRVEKKANVEPDKDIKSTV